MERVKVEVTCQGVKGYINEAGDLNLLVSYVYLFVNFATNMLIIPLDFAFGLVLFCFLLFIFKLFLVTIISF